MLCVVTFAAFLPSLRSSSVVWASTDAAHTIGSSASRRSCFMARILRRSLAVLTDGNDQYDEGGAEQDEERLRDFGRPGAFHQNCARDRHEVPHGIDHR